MLASEVQLIMVSASISIDGTGLNTLGDGASICNGAEGCRGCCDGCCDGCCYGCCCCGGAFDIARPPRQNAGLLVGL